MTNLQFGILLAVNILGFIAVGRVNHNILQVYEYLRQHQAFAKKHLDIIEKRV